MLIFKGIFIAFMGLIGICNCQSGCQKQVDVITVIDGSDSITDDDFDRMRRALSTFASNLQIDDVNVHFGIVVYSKVISFAAPLSGNKVEIIERSSGLPHDKEGTQTDLGIQKMVELFDTGKRSDVPKVGVVFTDGRSKNPKITADMARLAHNSGIQMFAVGIGSYLDDAELHTIASAVGNVLKMESFSELEAKIGDVVKFVCPATTTTPAPTTVSPYEPSTRRPAPGACDNCRIVNGIGYNPHPEDCDKFIQCYVNQEGQFMAIDKQCGYKQFWDQETLTCKYATEVKCSTDKCRFPGLLSHPYTGIDHNCKVYWACNEGKSEAMCCPPGYAYKHYFGCMPDSSCNDPCPPTFSGDAVGSCPFRPVSGEPRVYEQYVNGFGWMKRPCGDQTQYNPVSCTCEYHPSTEKVCTPELELTFDDLLDHSGKNTYVYAENVTLTGNGYAYFNGRSKIVIPRFANMGHYNDLVIQMKFLPTKSGVQGILSNGDCCNSDSTMHLVKSSSRLYFRADCELGLSSFRINMDPGNWNVVNYAHDTYSLQGHCNNYIKQSHAVGPIKNSAAGLQIGYKRNLGNFVGYMDYLKVYLCRPDLS